MDKMIVRVPVAVKAKVTEDLKLKIVGDLQNTIKNMELDLEQIDIERNKRTAAKQEAEAKLKRAEALELGAEIGHGTLERTVEITVGTNIDTLMGAEILTEDGKVIAFRE